MSKGDARPVEFWYNQSVEAAPKPDQDSPIGLVIITITITIIITAIIIAVSEQ